MHWKVKALMQSFFSVTPWGESANYFFQKRVTKSLPPNQNQFNTKVKQAKSHLSKLQKHLSDKSIGELTFYEFGAGWDLIIPVTFYTMGVDRQIVIDLRRLNRQELIVNTLSEIKQVMGLRRYPLDFNSCNINYIAPCDARDTCFKSKSIDCITSTNVLEHIPLTDIELIFKECRRILKDDGLISFMIDYQDHYSYFDKKISVYNFLKFSNKQWVRYNPDLHYQNRLRHKDYLKLICEAGFQVIDEWIDFGTQKDITIIQELFVDSMFDKYTIEELAIKSSWIVFKKK